MLSTAQIYNEDSAMSVECVVDVRDWEVVPSSTTSSWHSEDAGVWEVHLPGLQVTKPAKGGDLL